MTAKQKTETAALSANQIVRLKDGRKYFGYGPQPSLTKLKAVKFLSQSGLVTALVAGSALRSLSGSSG